MEKYVFYIMPGIIILLIAALIVCYIKYCRLKKLNNLAIDYWMIENFLLEAELNYLTGDSSIYREIVKALNESINLHSPKPPPAPSLGNEGACCITRYIDDRI